MRLATWNLARARRDGRRASALVAHMASVDADVWVLTETWRDLAPGEGHRLIAESASAPDRESAAGERWVAVWSRLPGAADALPTADAERTAATRLTAPGSRATIVYGTVLPWLSDARREPRGADAFCAALEAQREDWDRLRRESPDAELCVAGDFNQDLASRHYYGSKRGRAALAAALERTGLVCLTAGAGDPVPLRGGKASIDHLCVSAGLVGDRDSALVAWPGVSEHGARLTDHFGVAVTLARR